MGRIKPRPLKAITKEVFEKNEESFSKNFSENKEAVNKTLDVRSKKLRNVIAGYSARLKKQETSKNR